MKEALLVQYVGVYAPPPSVAQLGKNNQGGRPAARLHARATVDGDRRAGRARRHHAARRLGPAPARDVPLLVDGVRRRGHVALARVGHRRPEPPVGRRAAVPGRLHAVGAEGAERRARAEGRLHAVAPGERRRCRSRRRTAPSSRQLPPASLAGGHAVARLGRHDDGRREGAGRVVRRACRSRRARSARRSSRRRSRCGGSGSRPEPSRAPCRRVPRLGSCGRRRWARGPFGCVRVVTDSRPLEWSAGKS